MIDKISITPLIEFVISKGECGYQEVIDDFPFADFIRVTTFNISKKREHEYLIDALKDSPATDKRIYSNIPMFGKTEDVANETRNTYLDKLNPEGKNGLLTYFQLNNHSKIILTNNIAYIGSGNFTPHSDNNIEAGFLVRYTDIIKEICDFLPKYFNDTHAYYGTEASRLRVDIVALSNRLKKLWDELENEFQTSLLFADSSVQKNTLDSLVETLYAIADKSAYMGSTNDKGYWNCSNILGWNFAEDIQIQIEGDGFGLYHLASIKKSSKFAEYMSEEQEFIMDPDNIEIYESVAEDKTENYFEELLEKIKTDFKAIDNEISSILLKTQLIIDELTKMEENKPPLVN